MGKNKLSALTNEELLKRRNSYKSILTAFTIVFLFVMGITIYILVTGDTSKVSIASFVPVFMLPVMFTPVLVNFGQINNELKQRNLR